MPLVVVEIPVQFLDRVHELFPRPGFNGIHDQAVLGHGRQIPVQHEILAREVPEPILMGVRMRLAKYWARLRKKFREYIFQYKDPGTLSRRADPGTTRAKVTFQSYFALYPLRGKFFCRPRAMPISPLGTSLVMTEPAPTRALSPTLTGATRAVLLPIKAFSPMLV